MRVIFSALSLFVAACVGALVQTAWPSVAPYALIGLVGGGWLLIGLLCSYMFHVTDNSETCWNCGADVHQDAADCWNCEVPQWQR